MKTGERIKKEKVISALREMKAEGLSAFETRDPRAQKAQKLLDEWRSQLVREVEKDWGNKARHLANFEMTTVLVDAGYDDVNMLSNVLNWLNQDLQNAEDEESGDPEAAKIIKAKIDELEKKLAAAKG